MTLAHPYHVPDEAASAFRADETPVISIGAADDLRYTMPHVALLSLIHI